MKARRRYAGKKERGPEFRRDHSLRVLNRMRSLAQRAVLALLQAYKWAISPMFPPACRYTPTCSEYAMEAIERFGIVRGGCKAMMRILRCHPFVKGGYDPVVREPGTNDQQLTTTYHGAI